MILRYKVETAFAKTAPRIRGGDQRPGSPGSLFCSPHTRGDPSKINSFRDAAPRIRGVIRLHPLCLFIICSPRGVILTATVYSPHHTAPRIRPVIREPRTVDESTILLPAYAGVIREPRDSG